MIRDWWRHRREMRDAMEMSRLIDTGEMDLHVVATTPDGKTIQVPTPLLKEWNEMPPEVQQAFLDALDEHHRNDE